MKCAAACNKVGPRFIIWGRILRYAAAHLSTVLQTWDFIDYSCNLLTPEYMKSLIYGNLRTKSFKIEEGKVRPHFYKKRGKNHGKTCGRVLQCAAAFYNMRPHIWPKFLPRFSKMAVYFPNQPRYEPLINKQWFGIHNIYCYIQITVTGCLLAFDTVQRAWYRIKFDNI